MILPRVKRPADASWKKHTLIEFKTCQQKHRTATGHQGRILIPRLRDCFSHEKCKSLSGTQKTVVIKAEENKTKSQIIGGTHDFP